MQPKISGYIQIYRHALNNPTHSPRNAVLIVLTLFLLLSELYVVKVVKDSKDYNNHIVSAASPDKLEAEDAVLGGNVTVVNDSSASGGKLVVFGGSFSQKYEAESFSLLSPMQKGSDSNALGGQYIYPSTGTDSTTPVSEASLSVSIPSSGTYYLWARIMGPTLTSDALYVGIDNSWDRVFPSTTNTYEWVKVENGLNSGVYGYSLTAGNHTIQAGHGEINSRLDSVYLTQDANDVPTMSGTGGSSPTITPLPTSTPTVTTNIQGYGANTTGGAGKPYYDVTNLNDSGPGSLRDAISQSNRYIRILVSGTLNVTGSAKVVGTVSTYGQTYSRSMGCNGVNNITIDGSTAPGNGITIVGAIYFENCNNWIIKHIHARDAVANGNYQDDNFTLLENNHNFVFDHVSMSGAGDGSIDISFGSTDITVQWSILGPQSTNYSPSGGLPMDVYKDSYNVSIHHNLFWEGIDRHPTVGDSSHPDTIVSGRLNTDVRCNLVWAPKEGAYAITASANTHVNAVKNYFYLSTYEPNGPRAISSHSGGSVYSLGNWERRFNVTNPQAQTTMSEIVPPAYARITEEANYLQAAQAVLAGAGARVGGLDSIDQAKINAIKAIGL